MDFLNEPGGIVVCGRLQADRSTRYEWRKVVSGETIGSCVLGSEAKPDALRVSPDGSLAALIRWPSKRGKGAVVVCRLGAKTWVKKFDLPSEPLDEASWLSNARIAFADTSRRPRCAVRVVEIDRGAVGGRRAFYSLDPFGAPNSYQAVDSAEARLARAKVVPTARNQFGVPMWFLGSRREPQSYFNSSSGVCAVVGRLGGADGLWYVPEDSRPVPIIKENVAILSAREDGHCLVLYLRKSDGKKVAMSYDIERRAVLWSVECECLG